MLATRTKTYASAALNDADGLVESIATSEEAVELLPEDMVGGEEDDPILALDFPRTLSVTTGAFAGAYAIEEPIVVTGRRGSESVTEEFTLTDVDGDEVIYGTQVFDVVTSIAIPAMADDDGTFTFGLVDICAPAGDVFLAVQVDTAITAHFGFGGGKTDSIALAAKTRFDAAIERVLTGTAQTSGAAVTVFHGPMRSF